MFAAQQSIVRRMNADSIRAIRLSLAANRC
jgi:hypothetical protein